MSVTAANRPVGPTADTTMPGASPAGARARVSSRPAAQPAWGAWTVFVVLAVLMGVLGWRYLANLHIDFRRNVDRELTVIANLKARQIVEWYEERMGGGREIMLNPFLSDAVDTYLGGPASPVEPALLAWLDSVRTHNQGGRALLLDPGFKVCLASPPGRADLCPTGQAFAAEAVRAQAVTMSDLHRASGTGRVHLDLAVPVYALEPASQERAAATASGPRPVGVIHLEIDPHEFLFPLLETWPTAGRTGETLLVRREGDEVLYLSDLRHPPHRTTGLRLPLSRTNTLGVKAGWGHSGPAEGENYRGQPVMGAIRSVPGTPWHLVAEVAREEAFGPLRRNTVLVLAAISSAIAVAGLTLAGLWRRREERFLKAELALERERQLLAQRLLQISRQANDIILLLDSQPRVIDANDRALAAYGYSLEELRGLQPADLRAPEARQNLGELGNDLEREKGLCYETEHRRKDGSIFPVEVSVRLVEVDGERFFQALIRDITERRQREDQLRKLSGAVEHSPLSILITNRAGDIEYVNPKFCALTGYTAAEVHGRNPRLLKSGHTTPEEYRQLWETISRGQEWRGEFHNRKKNGEVYWEAASISPLCDASGHVTHFVAVKEDISERKKAETERELLIKSLEEALANVKTLSGLVPICAGCKKIRDDKGFWNQLESYVTAHSNAKFSHGMCPDCARKWYPDIVDALESKSQPSRP